MSSKSQPRPPPIFLSLLRMCRWATSWPAAVSTVESETVLADGRVLAIDQTFRQDEETNQVVVAKRTATLELNPRQSEVVSMAETAGLLSLILRSLAENDGKALADVGPHLS